MFNKDRRPHFLFNIYPFPVSSVPFAFVVMKENASEKQEAVVKELRQLVATKIAKYAVPEHFLVCKHIILK